MKKLKFKINKSLKGIPEGTILALDVDEDLLPINKYWRNRVVDALIDNCIEVFCSKEEQLKEIKEQKKKKTHEIKNNK